MRQILTMLFFSIVSPPAAVVYFLFCAARALVQWHRKSSRYRFSTPAQRERFEEQHSERLFRIDRLGQPVRLVR